MRTCWRKARFSACSVTVPLCFGECWEWSLRSTTRWPVLNITAQILVPTEPAAHRHKDKLSISALAPDPHNELGRDYIKSNWELAVNKSAVMLHTLRFPSVGPETTNGCTHQLPFCGIQPTTRQTLCIEGQHINTFRFLDGTTTRKVLAVIV